MVNPNGSPKSGGEGESSTKEEMLSKMTDQELLEMISEKAAEERKKSQNRGSSVLGAIDKKFLAGGLAATIGLSAAGFAGYKISKNGGGDQATKPDLTPAPAVEVVETEDSAEVEKGIIDGYNKEGMWLSGEKERPYNFASAVEVAELCDNNPKEMLKYTATNQVETLASYLVDVPKELRPASIADIDNLKDMEAKLESSDDIHDECLEAFNKAIDNSTVKFVKVNGDYSSAYIAYRDENGLHDRNEAVQIANEEDFTHENMEAVASKVNMKNKTVVQIEFVDEKNPDKVLGNMKTNIQMSEDAPLNQAITFGEDDVNYEVTGGCEQNLEDIARGEVLFATTTFVENEVPPEAITPDKPNNPDKPTPTPPVPTPETVQPKSYENTKRIDNNIQQDIADNIGTEQVVVTPSYNPGPVTEAPAPESYSYTAPVYVENATVAEATPVEAYVSPENNYSNDAAPSVETYTPVEANQDAQDKANANENTRVATTDQAANDFGFN